MKILIAPLNWGLGHATRCIPLVRQHLEQGDEVVLAGDGDSLLLLQRHFPQLRVINLPSLELRYTANDQQRGFYLRAIPALLRFTIADHYYLRQQLAIEHFDLIISDNRFGFFTRQTRCVYITHQLYIRLPRRLRIFQPLARAVHACIIKRYHEVWVPDYENMEESLAGELCHGGRYDAHVKYIGPLSRFASSEGTPKELRRNSEETPKPYHAPVAENTEYSVVAILSGLEPQRSIFERAILERYANTSEKVLLVRGKVAEAQTMISRNNITIVASLSDQALLDAMEQATTIIARSGYSTIMDLAVLGLLHKAELYPTPGQSEQEYLASRF
jgi:UDP:flavonoid glycosyltransferase YjiC (YdhE family)